MFVAMTKKGQINVAYKGRRIAFNGQEKLIGQASRYSTIGYDAIVAYAAKAAAVPESSIEMSMEALFDALNYFVLNGHSVQIPYLGTFSLGVRVKSSESEAEFTNNFSRNLRGVKIHFLPDSDLKAMIASTSISTSVDEEGYQSNGVIAITSGLVGVGTGLYPLNEGRVYELEAITRVVLNGTRLSASYLPATAARITFIDVNGAESVQSFAGTYISQAYGSFTINLKKFADDNPQFVAMKKIEVKVDDTTYYTKTFAAPVEEVPAISAININGKPVAEGGTYPFKAGEAVTINCLVAQSTFVDVVKIGGAAITPASIGEGRMKLVYTPAASGNAPISVKSNESAESIYNLSFGEAGSVSIVSITANGDALNNGGTTNITAGTNYAIQIQGAGLEGLTAENFTLPSGSSIAITSQSNTMIAATLSNAQAGDFKVTVDEIDIFTAALVAVNPAVSVTGYKLTDQGATQQLSVAVNANQETGAFDVVLVGNNIDDLTTADFSGTGLSSLSYAPATGHISGVVDSGSRTLVIQSDGTTIATLTIVKPSQGGDGGDDLDQG